jgi:hypothetical protein
MAPQDIHRKLKAKPFQPFKIFVSDGASYEIREPTHSYVALTELVVGLDPDANDVPSRSVYIAPNHVTRIEPIMPASRGA